MAPTCSTKGRRGRVSARRSSRKRACSTSLDPGFVVGGARSRSTQARSCGGVAETCEAPPCSRARSETVEAARSAPVFAAGLEEVPIGDCGEEVVAGFGAAMERMAALAVPVARQKVSRFHSVSQPGINISNYLKRLHKFFFCSPESYVLAMVFVDRLSKKHPDISVSPLSCHRLVACALTVAAKFQDDVFYSNKYYAKVAGLTLAELNALEMEMLRLLDYRLFTAPAEFDVYRSLLAAAAKSLVH
mmetsp:Transcript_87823/g.253284  ORF Transcript_87823/g.253284 Transcript_87823/m.253284 type:complete len:246 (-) Transcript_87823:83-820(-)